MLCCDWNIWFSSSKVEALLKKGGAKCENYLSALMTHAILANANMTTTAEEASNLYGVPVISVIKFNI